MIFKIQKKAVRILFKKLKRDSCKPLFKEHGILTLYSVFIYKNLKKKKKKKKNIEIRSDMHQYNLRNNTNLHIKATRLVKSDKTPSIMSRKLYNKLPIEIKTLEIKIFKKKVISFLINNVFYNINEYLEPKWKVTDFT
ncbi:hypothetical protein O3M35_000349 [Rhynocoris fuscipes]|uniref:Uncharacterized protein n=1 Tax=Rhynocoris fuscipes TaxID=488301 RepID=A0AAW1DL36_9HEMI